MFIISAQSWIVIFLEYIVIVIYVKKKSYNLANLTNCNKLIRLTGALCWKIVCANLKLTDDTHTEYFFTSNVPNDFFLIK